MSYRITYVVDIFRNGVVDAASEDFIQGALFLLLQRNIEYLQTHPETPRLYDTDLVYREEPAGQEEWRDIPTMLEEGRRGYNDCEDLACWRAAEVNVLFGIPAVPYFTHRVLPDGKVVYHIRVKYPNGHIEDPSRIKGMR